MSKPAHISYLRVITPEEELEGRKERFEQIQMGTIFWLGELEGERYFLAVGRLNDTTLEVAELDEANRIRIVSGRRPKYSTLTFDQMHCLNVPRQDP